MRPTLPPPKPALTGLRILVVDDDADVRDAVSEMLRHAGATVRGAPSASEAWQEFAAFRPELVMCDLRMPVEDGFHLIGKIRGLDPEHGGRVSAIALSALTSKEDAARALAAGFQLHLTKPVDLERLAAAVISLTTDAKRSE